MSELSYADALIDRVIDRTVTSADWQQIADLARADDQVWSDVTAALRADDAARTVTDQVSALAGRIDLAEELEATAAAPVVETLVAPGDSPSPLHGLFRWSGWVAAAAITLAFLMNGVLGDSSPMVDPPPAHRAALTSDAALNAYVQAGRQEGRILELLPHVTVRAARAVEGGVEVVFIRRFVERIIVEDDAVWRLAADEHGRAIAIPAGDALRQQRGSL